MRSVLSDFFFFLGFFSVSPSWSRELPHCPYGGNSFCRCHLLHLRARILIGICWIWSRSPLPHLHLHTCQGWSCSCWPLCCTCSLQRPTRAGPTLAGMEVKR